MKGTNSTYNILQLQNLIKRQPELYYEEFYSHYQYYQSLLKLYMLTPQHYDENLADLVMFLAHISTCYKDELKDYHQELMNILKPNYSVIDAGMRMCFCKALILLRNKDLIEATELTPLFFHLMRSEDKKLRLYLMTHIIADIKKMNLKHKDMVVNSALQTLMYKMLKDKHTKVAKMSLDIMIELYRKHIWRDTKTVNAIASACFSKENKILVAAHQFFLGVDEEGEKDSSDSEDDTAETLKDVMSSYKVNKKNKKRKSHLKRAKKAVISSKKKKNKEVFDFSAIHLLHDPQGMAEKLLKMLTEMHEMYEIKMMVMNLISRLVGVNQLILLNFYPLLLRYLRPHQRDVTRILTFAAQSAHEYVPPDVMEPVVKTIADNFVSERNSDEAITVGINAIREICARCPLAISQELLQDVTEYKSYKNKNVMMAARSLIQIYRTINPELLKRKFRSRPTEASKESTMLEYGALKAKSYIPGSEVLPIEPPTEEATSEKVENDDGNDSDGSWINVSHSGDELNSDEEGDDDDDDDSEGDEEGEEKDGCSKKTNSKKNAKNKDNNTENSNKESETSDKNVVDQKEKAMMISQSRILSQEEFKKLKAAQICKQVKFAKGKKRKVEVEVEINGKEIVSLKDIERLHKRPKPNKESRLATVMEGREGREKFGRKKKKKSPLSSKTQKENNKKKAFMMVKYKVKGKQKRSFKDKQISLRNSLLKQKRRR